MATEHPRPLPPPTPSPDELPGQEPDAALPSRRRLAMPLRPRADEPARDSVPSWKPDDAVATEPQPAAVRTPIQAEGARAGPALTLPDDDPRPAVTPADAALTPRPRPRPPGTEPGAEIPGPDPVINITIGRIEVRAVPAPGGERRAEPAARLAAKPLSLEEYLRRREVSR
jgi:hypothetical protein